VKAAYLLLRLSPTEFSSLWDWSPLFSLLAHPNPKVKFYVNESLRIFLGIGDKNARKIGQKYQALNLKLPASMMEEESLETVLLFFETHEINCEYHQLCVTKADFGESLVDVCGILLQKKNSNSFEERYCFSFFFSIKLTSASPSSFIYIPTSEGFGVF